MEASSGLKVKIFADGADYDGIIRMYKNPLIKGFTTNPTLMRKAGIIDYEAFARKVLAAIPDRPISFEVFADDFHIMVMQGKEIASWGHNVNVKIPVTNTQGEFAGPVIKELSHAGVTVNVTAVMTLRQVQDVVLALADDAPAIVSIFAGRIADTGRDPVPLMSEALDILKQRPRAELIWASPRELLNIFQAELNRLPHHNSDQRCSGEAISRRKEPRNILPGNRRDVSSRRRRGRVFDPNRTTTAKHQGCLIHLRSVWRLS